MNNKIFFSTFLLLLAIHLTVSAQFQQTYQLTIYSFEDEQQESATDDYLENVFLPALSRQGIENVGVFKNRKDTYKDSLCKTYVLIPFISLYQFQTLEAQLNADPIYAEHSTEFLSSPFNQPPYQRKQIIVMKALEGMQMLKPCSLESPRSERIYELRSYQSATESLSKNKIEMFNSEEIQLFKDLDINAVFYAEVIAGPAMPNLMYMTTHENQTQRDINWANFDKSPGWKQMFADKKYQNNISNIDFYYLYPTHYSDY